MLGAMTNQIGKNMRYLAPALAFFFVLVAVLAPALAAPKAELWDRWMDQDPASKERVDHSAWDGFLKAYVRVGDDGINRVAYGRVTDVDRKALDTYLSSLEATPVSKISRAEQLPFWINLYNSLTLRLILERYPIGSIREIDISPGLFADGPWGKALATVDGEAVSLDDIEHRILRPIWKDPRIHYAVNCASIGCPNLHIEAYTAENTETLLSDSARAYINHSRGARVEDGKLTVSSIYRWFADDFGGTDETIIAHLKRYADGALKNALDEATKIDGHAYDWALNDAK
jgi:uncharacterized protein DUF547